MRACANYPGVECARSCALTGRCAESERRTLDVARPEPAPVKNHHRPVQDLVVEDIAKRKQMGLAKYGTLLQPFNGRDALKDAYEESLDQTIYLRQLLEERALGADAPLRGWRRFVYDLLTR